LAASSFLVLRLRLGGGNEVRAPSRMTRAPLLRLGGADGGSRLTVLGVDAEDRDADLVADPEDADSVARHCSPGGGGEVDWGEACECGRPGAVGRDI
jgi:hypothetical protein